MFLAPAELVTLTGKRQKSGQVDQLRRMGVPYYVNAAGHPVVARAVIEGGKQTIKQPPVWRPAVLGS